jgi:hypothetical protein
MNVTLIDDCQADAVLGVPAMPTTYDYIFALGEFDDWTRLDTKSDTAHFGIWLNRHTLSVFVFRSGTRKILQLASREEYLKTVDRLARSHGTILPSEQLVVHAQGELTFRFPRPITLQYHAT